MMFRSIAAALALIAISDTALAQSSPGLSYGQTPTAGQWNSFFASKQDVLKFTPLSQAGGTMTGKLQTSPSTINGAGFSILPGIAPTTPVNGDLWLTSVGLFARVNGQTIQFSNGSGYLAVNNALSEIAAAGTQATARGSIGAAQSGSNADITSLSNLSAILDGTFGAARGTIAVRGPSGWSSLPLGTSGYTLQSNGTDLVYGTVSPGTGAVRYDASQTLTSGQQDQARANVATPTASSPGSSTTLTGTDIDRPLYATGTITITSASLANANWRSGPIFNANANIGSITLAVPSGASLDGVTNGTTILLPKQKARIVQTGAATYVTDWIDRSPIVASAKITSAVASASFNLPAGYSAFDFTVAGLKVDTAGATVGARFASDGATFRAGASDYYELVNGAANNSSTVSAAYASQSFMEIAYQVAASLGIPLNARGTIHPGDANTQAMMLFTSSYYGNGGPLKISSYVQVYNGGSNALMNAIQFLSTSGNITTGNITIRGIPAP